MDSWNYIQYYCYSHANITYPRVEFNLNRSDLIKISTQALLGHTEHEHLVVLLVVAVVEDEQGQAWRQRRADDLMSMFFSP
jgi:hypothetical protein